MTTTSPGLSSLTSIPRTQVRKVSSSIAPSTRAGAATPFRRRPAISVIVFQCPWGTGARQRSLRRDRPRRRAILVETPLSSMNTGRAGAISGRRSNHVSRRLKTSSRLCSLACAVFFIRQPALAQEAPQRAQLNAHAMVGVQTLHHLRQRDIGPAFYQPEKIPFMQIQPRPARVASRLHRHASRAPVLARLAPHRRLADAQMPADRAQRQPLLHNQLHRSKAKILAQRSHGRPPCTGDTP